MTDYTEGHVYLSESLVALMPCHSSEKKRKQNIRVINA